MVGKLLAFIEKTMADEKESRRKHPRMVYHKYKCQHCSTVWYAKYIRCPSCGMETGMEKTVA